MVFQTFARLAIDGLDATRYVAEMGEDKWIHRKSLDIPWDAHYLTFSCFGRQPFFNGRQSPGWFLELLERARVKVGFDLWGFVVMPEHVHLILLPHEGVLIRTILSRIKEPLARRVLGWVHKNSPAFLSRMSDRQPGGKTTYRFWQRGGGYDRNLRSTHDVHEKLNYVHQNPVLRGLVTQPGDWPWSSWRAWETGTDDPIRIDRETFPILRKH